MMSSKPSNDNKAFLDKITKWNETQFKYIDVIVSSGIIRKEFFSRCKALDIDPYRVAMKAGITPSIFKSKYVNIYEPVCTKSFDQVKFLKMIELVGIDIRVLVKTKPLDKVSVELREIGIIKD